MNETDQSKSRHPQSNFGWAWVGLVLAVAAHVADEALNDLLAFYNPTVERIREQLPWFPLPTYTYDGWMTGLIVGVTLLLAMSPFAFEGARWMRWFAMAFGVFMLLNGMLHIALSFYMGDLIPGVYSSPLLLAASIYLLLVLRRSPPHRS